MVPLQWNYTFRGQSKNKMDMGQKKKKKSANIAVKCDCMSWGNTF